MNENPETTKVHQSPDTLTNQVVVKKKQPTFWEREIKIANTDNVDQNAILTHLQLRFRSGFNKWRKQAKVFRAANFCVTLLIIVLQVAQVVAFQFPTLSFETKTALATVLPAVTGAILALQLKLNWSDKGQKCKKTARMYKKLASHVDYRLQMLKAGGEFNDAPKLWNLALISEIKEVPVFLSVY